MIVRGPKPVSGYYVLKNDIARDESLSWAARGLLIRLLTCEDGWQVCISALVKETKEARVSSGRDAVYALLKELETAGYVTKVQGRLPSGKMGAIDYRVSELKSVPDLGVAPPLPDEPDTVNPTQRITKASRSTNESNYSVEAHRKICDAAESAKPNSRQVGKRAKPGESSHPIYGEQLAKLVADGVSEKRARGCLATLLKVVCQEGAIEMLEGFRSDGLEGASLIDVIMTYAYGEMDH